MPSASEEAAGAAGEHGFAFGRFRLFPGRRLLLEGDNQIRLGSRALDILVNLVERAGRLVPKEELIARVWPNLFVEESNLKIQVSALRRALGEGQAGSRYIATIPGRGYEFVAPVNVTQEPTIATAPSVRMHNLPVALTRMIGRAEILDALRSRLQRQRLVTIVGPGGIGKTTLALGLAETMLTAYPDGVRMVDLAPLGDPNLVPSAVATALNFEIRAENPLSELVASLRDRQMLLLLDNCEHVVEAAAALANNILRAAARVRILATSREPLRVEGETLHHLAPLALPPSSPNLTAAEALNFPAVQLFVERAGAVLDDFALSDADAPLVAEICRKLDGLPLAMEFAASRIDVFGIAGLASSTDDRLRRLGTRRRGITPRQLTMTATLDWSYGLLSEDEQIWLRRAAIFAGGFTVEAGAAVAMDALDRRSEAFERLADLVTKSLVATDISEAGPRFRLLETTRAYALEKLGESGELEVVARRHAEYYRSHFEGSGAEFETRPISEWLTEYSPELDNLRIALDWAFSARGNEAIGVALTACAVPLLMHLSLMEECRSRVERALTALETPANWDARRAMELHAALGAVLTNTRGVTGPQIGSAWTRTLELAEGLQNVDYQLRALCGLWYFHTAGSRHRIALEFAEKYRILAANGLSRNDPLIIDRMIGVSRFYRGDLSDARRHIERLLAADIAPDRPRLLIRFQLDLQVMARLFLARIQWLQGFPEQALRAAESTVDTARASNHAWSLCYALALGACPIALLVGDLAAAAKYVQRLIDQSTRHSFARWRAFGRGHEGSLAINRGDLGTGLRLMRAALDELNDPESPVPFTAFPFTAFLMTEALGQAGQVTEALAAVNHAINHADETEEYWRMAELLREKGELLLLQDPVGAAVAAEDHFRRALDWAVRQGALIWEIRAATSFARLLRDQGRSDDAEALLRPVYNRFTEGFETVDLKAAEVILAGLR